MSSHIASDLGSLTPDITKEHIDGMWELPLQMLEVFNQHKNIDLVWTFRIP